MKRTFISLCLFCAGLSIPAMAQDYPRAEGFVGYSYARFNQNTTSGTTQTNIHSNLNGAIGQGTLNLTHMFGVVAEFGGYRISNLSGTTTSGATSVTVNGAVSGSVLTYLFGPRVSFRGSDRVTPFVHALFGGARASDITSGAVVFCGTVTLCTISSSQNAFATALGGGLDVKVADHIAVRLGQAEYLMTRFKNAGVADTQNNFRYSAGIVIR